MHTLNGFLHNIQNRRVCIYIITAPQTKCVFPCKNLASWSKSNRFPQVISPGLSSREMQYLDASKRI
jgi:hypothetical protein